MTEINLGSHTIRSHGSKLAKTHMHDWIILVLLGVLDVILNLIHPFYRFVGKEMMADFKYPMKENTVPILAVPVSWIFFCISQKISWTILRNYYLPKNIKGYQWWNPFCFVFCSFLGDFDGQIYAVLLPILVFLIFYSRRRCVYDLHHAILGDFQAKFAVILFVTMLQWLLTRMFFFFK